MYILLVYQGNNHASILVSKLQGSDKNISTFPKMIILFKFSSYRVTIKYTNTSLKKLSVYHKSLLISVVSYRQMNSRNEF